MIKNIAQPSVSIRSTCESRGAFTKSLSKEKPEGTENGNIESKKPHSQREKTKAAYNLETIKEEKVAINAKADIFTGNKPSFRKEVLAVQTKITSTPVGNGGISVGSGGSNSINKKSDVISSEGTTPVVIASANQSSSYSPHKKEFLVVHDDSMKVAARKANKILGTWHDDDGKAIKDYSLASMLKEAGLITQRLYKELDQNVLCYSPGVQFFSVFLGCLGVGVVTVVTCHSALSLMLRMLIASLPMAMCVSTVTCRFRGKYAATEVPWPWCWRSFLHPLGHAVEFGTDWRSFLAKYTKICGGIFRCRIALESMTFVTDHRVVAQMIKHSNVFRFDVIAVEKAEMIFGIALPTKAHLEFHKVMVKQLMGPNLDCLANRFVSIFQTIMTESYRAKDGWIELNAKNFVDHIVFAGTSRAIAGDFDDGIISPELKNHFDNFDDNLFLLAAGIPEIFLRSTRSSQDYVKKYLEGLPITKQTEFMTFITDWLQENAAGVDRAKVLFLMVWATITNSKPGLFWPLMFLLRDDQAMDELKEEAQTIVQEDSGWTIENNSSFPPLEPKTLKRAKKIQSYMLDCLRIQSSYLPLRQLSQDHVVKLKSGEKFKFYKGDIVMGGNQHHREDIYPDPSTPKVDRFLPGRSAMFRDKFGESVVTPNLSFGMGNHTCPGKTFFLHEASAVFITLLLSYDMELVHPDTAVPSPNMKRMSRGCMPLDPTYENDPSIQIRIKRKQSCS